LSELRFLPSELPFQFVGLIPYREALFPHLRENRLISGMGFPFINFWMVMPAAAHPHLARQATPAAQRHAPGDSNHEIVNIGDELSLY
jgi:hypothetical protein